MLLKIRARRVADHLLCRAKQAGQEQAGGRAGLRLVIRVLLSDGTEVACPQTAVGQQHRGARDDQDQRDENQGHLPPPEGQETCKRRGDRGSDGAHA